MNIEAVSREVAAPTTRVFRLCGRASSGFAIVANPPGVKKPVTILVADDRLIRSTISDAISRCGRSNRTVDVEDMAGFDLKDAKP